MDVFEKLKAIGDVPDTPEGMEARFSGPWRVLGSSTPGAKPVVSSEASLAMLSFGLLPPKSVAMRGSYVTVESGEYCLMHTCDLKPGAAGAAGGEFVAVLSGVVDFGESPALGVTFKQFTVAPILGEGGEPVLESAAAVAEIANEAGKELDGEGRIVAALPPQIASNRTTITVVHNDGAVHAHEGFMKYLLQKADSAPECAVPRVSEA